MYQGLPRATLIYLADLAAQNDKAWFDAHKEAYDRLWLAAGLDLIAALSGPVSAMGLMAVPKLGQSLRRIHRDVRFSKDKRPYDPRLHLILSTGAALGKVPGVHVVIGAEGMVLGAGHWAFDGENLTRLRRAFADAERRAELLGLLDKAARHGLALDAPDLARLPRDLPEGVIPAPEWDYLLRMKHLVLRHQIPQPIPDWLFGPDAAQHLADIIADLAPVAHWCVQTLEK